MVNGVGMTSLTPMTKMMAHLPLTLLGHAPKKANRNIRFWHGHDVPLAAHLGFLDVTAVESSFPGSRRCSRISTPQRGAAARPAARAREDRRRPALPREHQRHLRSDYH